MIITHNFTSLKTNGMTEDIFIRLRVWARSLLTREWALVNNVCVNIGPASLHFVQNYPSSVSKTLQSWCRALKVFYQTSLLPLCNVFCHVYERSLKLLETRNISSVSRHKLKSSDKFFHFHLQMDGY